jgi:hypothetical protein
MNHVASLALQALPRQQRMAGRDNQLAITAHCIGVASTSVFHLSHAQEEQNVPFPVKIIVLTTSPLASLCCN